MTAEDSDLASLSARDIASAVRARSLRAVDVVTSALERIRRVDPELCAFAEVWEEEGLRRAREVDLRVDGGERPPLCWRWRGRHRRTSEGTSGQIIAHAYNACASI